MRSEIKYKKNLNFFKIFFKIYAKLKWKAQ